MIRKRSLKAAAKAQQRVTQLFAKEEEHVVRLFGKTQEEQPMEELHEEKRPWPAYQTMEQRLEKRDLNAILYRLAQLERNHCREEKRLSALEQHALQIDDDIRKIKEYIKMSDWPAFFASRRASNSSK